jgi:hypothetical protein
MRIILKHGKDVENGNKEDIAEIAICCWFRELSHPSTYFLLVA